jgi:hypothetical protein
MKAYGIGQGKPRPEKWIPISRPMVASQSEHDYIPCQWGYISLAEWMRREVSRIKQAGGRAKVVRWHGRVQLLALYRPSKEEIET